MNKIHAVRKIGFAVAVVTLAGCAGTHVASQHDTMTRVDDGFTKNTSNVVVRQWDKGEEMSATPTVAAHEKSPAAPAQSTELKVVRALGVTPPDANPGECFGKVLVPAQYRDEHYEQVVRAASETISWTNPEYEDVEQQVISRPAYSRAEVVPAVYEEVSEQVLVRAAYRREIEVPALYDTYFEQVVERPARKVWKPGRGETEKIDAATGEILCLVEEPAVYKTVERKEVKREASKRYEDIPAEYETVKKQVIKSPEEIRQVEVPAQFTKITARKLVKPAEQIKTPVAAQTETVNRKALVADERYEWRQILCEQNATPETINQIRSELNKKGYGPLAENGTIDSILTRSVRKYQGDNGIAVDGMLSIPTLTALGVNHK